MLPEGAILFSSRAPIGLVAIAGVPMCTNQGFKNFVPGKEVDSRFLYWTLRNLVPRIRDMGNGATFKEVSKAVIERVEIPLPKLEEQKQIAAILDKADAIRRKRQEARDIANHLIDVAFNHLFGDCLVNGKEFEPCDFQDLCGKIVDCPHSTPTYADTETEFACVRSSDLQDGYIDWESTKYVTNSEYETRVARHTPVAGEVLYTREGGRLGNAAQVPAGSQVCLGQRIMLFSAKQGETTNEFLWALLNSPGVRHQVNTLTAGAAAPRVNISDIRKLQGFRPPFKLQEQFTKAVDKIEQLRQKQIAAETDETDLFNSLVQRAFKGEL